MKTELSVAASILLLLLIIFSVFFMTFIVITVNAAIKAGMPGFKEYFPKKEKGKWLPFTGLRSRFNAFGSRDYNFFFTFRSNRIAYVVSRIMAMYLDYFTITDARTYSVIWGIKRQKEVKV